MPTWDELHAFIDAAYEAVGIEGEWPALLQRASRLMEADGAILLQGRPPSDDAPAVTRMVSAGVTPAAAQGYASLAPSSPIAQKVYSGPIGRLSPVYHLLDRDHAAWREFQEHWANPHGMADGLLGVIERDGAEVSVLTVVRGRNGPFRPFEESEPLAALAARHLGRALRLHRRLTNARSPGAEMMAAIRLPAFALDDAGHVEWANPAGDRLLASKRVLSVRDHRLDAVASEGRAPLARLLAAARQRRGGTITMGVPPIYLSAMPLTGATAGAAMLLVHDPACDDEPAGPIERHLRLTWPLTAAEAAAMVAVDRSATLKTAAATLGVGEATVHTHLSRAFQKCGLHSQRELARVLQSMRLIPDCSAEDEHPVS